LDAFELDGLDAWHLELTKMCPVDLVIYLRADPEVCLQRVKSRARQEESSITVEFLTAIHKRHEEWLLQKKFPEPAPVLVLNANLGISEVLAQAEEQEARIMSLL